MSKIKKFFLSKDNVKREWKYKYKPKFGRKYLHTIDLDKELASKI